MLWSKLYFESETLNTLLCDGVTWHDNKRLPPLILLGDCLIRLAGQDTTEVIISVHFHCKRCPAECSKSLIEPV